MAKRKDITAIPSMLTRTIMAAGMTEKERNELLQGMVEAINKEHGDRSIYTLDSVVGADHSPFLIPTGSLGLDMSIGPMRREANGRWRHGLPPYKMVEIFGPESSGKTTLALRMVAHLQAQYRTLGLSAAYIDLEHSLDREYASRLGVNNKTLLYSQADSGSSALEIIDHLLGSRMMGIIVLDSVAALLTDEEMKGEVTDSQVAGQARMMSQALRKYTNKLLESPTLLVFINQTRGTIGFGDTTTGGRALRFYSAVRISMKKGDFIKYPASSENRVGQRLKTNTVKNKFGPPFREADAPLYYGVGVDPFIELAELAYKGGLLALNGSWYTHPPTGLKGQGLAGFVEHMRASPDMCREMKNELCTRFMAARGMTPEGALIPGAQVTHAPGPVPLDYTPEPTKEEVEGG